MSSDPSIDALFFAIVRRSISGVLRQLNLGVDIESKDYLGRTALTLAASLESRSLVELFIMRGAVLSERTVIGCVASRYETLPCLRLLLQHKGNPNSMHSNGATALHIVVSRSSAPLRLSSLNLLLEYRADVSRIDNRGLRAIDLCRDPSDVRFKVLDAVDREHAQKS